MGTTEVPATPKRVVVLDTAPLDAAIALGIKPVGTIIYRSPPAYIREMVADIEVIGDGNSPNVEAILALKPDLILGSAVGMTDERYLQLSEIAPTVLTEGSGREGEWRENFRLFAEALGESEAAAELIKSYEDDAKELKGAIAQREELEVSVLLARNNVVRTYTTQSFAGSVLEDVGLSRPPAQDLRNQYAVPLSAEATATLDGDYIFLIYFSAFEDSTSKETFIRHPVWSQLRAVKDSKVCEVRGDTWVAGRNILAAKQILTDVEKCLESKALK